ncbi:hypothetical protein NIES806_33700 [Dolichospermum compactum NIES-806]|uniref:Putative restriction endonuclease domain-containing protein n=1 Tax=Dolichospermum compactum NIES-806 TaxID=1973481 RepID=A0A1Z4V6I8_9CYAN|nr:hypothetical protein NIES806_33700 [Dolichospermum compactum NIES-806]
MAGQVFAIAGASEEHNLIVTNIIAILRPHLRGSYCRAFVSDMKVKVKIRNANIFYYPDIIVTCDPEDKERYFKTRPNLIIEVLSNYTATIDKREKRINYQTIDSLKEYILVYQNQMKVEVYRQDDQGNWSTEVLGTDDKLHLESVNLTLTMADVVAQDGGRVKGMSDRIDTLKQLVEIVTTIAVCTCMRYIIAPSSLAGRGLGVGFLYLTQSRTAISFTLIPTITATDLANAWVYAEAYPDEIELAIEQNEAA